MATGAPLKLSTPAIRGLSTAAATLLVGGSALMLAGGNDAAGRLAIALGSLASALVMGGSIGARAPQPGELDEREQGERARAMMTGYAITAGLLCALAIWLTLAGVVTSISLGQPGLHALGMVLMSLFWLHTLLPSAVLAWRDRGNAAGNEED